MHYGSPALRGPLHAPCALLRLLHVRASVSSTWAIEEADRFRDRDLARGFDTRTSILSLALLLISYFKARRTIRATLVRENRFASRELARSRRMIEWPESTRALIPRDNHRLHRRLRPPKCVRHFPLHSKAPSRGAPLDPRVRIPRVLIHDTTAGISIPAAAV